jgi:ribosomal protein S14
VQRSTIGEVWDDIREIFHPVWSEAMRKEEEKKNPEMEVRYNKYKEPPRCKKCGRPSALIETEVGKITWWCFYCDSPRLGM